MKLQDLIQGLREVHDAIEGGMAGDDAAIQYLREVLEIIIVRGEPNTILDMALHLYDRSLSYAERVAESN